MGAFPYKTVPYDHQREALRVSARAAAFMLQMDPGSGKSKVALDTFGDGWLRRTLDALLIVAPSDVYRGWSDQIETHLINDAAREARVIVWDAARMKAREERARKKGEPSLAASLVTEELCPIILMNIEAVNTPLGFATARRLLAGRKGMMVLDESADIATPSAKRTRKVWALGKLAVVRRTLDGTPLAESPLEAYGQYSFLDRRILGVRDYKEFKERYAEWVEREIEGRPTPVRMIKKVWRDGDWRPVYKNLDDLRRRIDPYTFRASKPPLPPKVYIPPTYLDLSDASRTAYEQLKTEYLLEVGTGIIDGIHVLARMARLQQIALGYLPTTALVLTDEERDTEEPYRLLDGGTTAQRRVAALTALMARYPGPTIVWVRYKIDADMIGLYADESFRARATRYDGSVSDAEKARALDDFAARRKTIIVANTAAGGRGLNELIGARLVVYYSHYFGLRLRLQSEDRAHRIGITDPVFIGDLLATDTIEMDIVRSHRRKQPVANYLHGHTTEVPA